MRRRRAFHFAPVLENKQSFSSYFQGIFRIYLVNRPVFNQSLNNEYCTDFVICLVFGPRNGYDPDDYFNLFQN